MRGALVFFVLALALARAHAASLGPRAYVTLLYSDDFDVAVRVLGASLERSGTLVPRVCLYTAHVSQQVVLQLASEGWHMHAVPTIDLPPALQEAKFRYIYSKLAVWNLASIGLERVVFLDGDILVRRNVDHLFECGPVFCAATRLEDYFNGGVFVLATNATLYRAMMARLDSDARPRYAGEQTFLNEMLGVGVRSGTFFGERGNEDERSPEPGVSGVPGGGAWRGGAPSGFQRLSFSYNADPLLYTLSGNRWKMPWDEVPATQRGPHLVHYSGTQGKPWSWYAYLFFAQTWEWHAVRRRLEPAASAFYSPEGDVLTVVWSCVLIGAVAWAAPRVAALAAHGVRPSVPAEALSVGVHLCALALAPLGVGVHATPLWGAAQWAAAYAFVILTLLFALDLAVLGRRAAAPLLHALTHGVAAFALFAALMTWRGGSMFAKVALLAAAVCATTHTAVAHGAALRGRAVRDARLPAPAHH